ncbi:MAG: hypothetical protein IKA79_08995 [Lentisphaeria bacterium]|nr:hypothetical protein [Lentisphaeria bacterium]
MLIKYTETRQGFDFSRLSVPASFRHLFRKFLYLFIFLSPALLLVSCTSFEAGSDKRLSELAAHMIKHTGGQISAMMMVEPVRASDGLAIKIAGREVAFYKYDLTLPKAKKKYEHVRAHKAVYISGVRFDAEINGPFMMIDHTKNLKRQELIKAFHDFR